MSEEDASNEQLLPHIEVRGDEDRPFTPYERQQIRQLLLADKRRQWVLSTILIIAKWVSGVGAAMILMQDYLKKLLIPGVPH